MGFRVDGFGSLGFRSLGFRVDGFGGTQLTVEQSDTLGFLHASRNQREVSRPRGKLSDASS